MGGERTKNERREGIYSFVRAAFGIYLVMVGRCGVGDKGTKEIRTGKYTITYLARPQKSATALGTGNTLQHISYNDSGSN